MPETPEIDHKNLDGLDCRWENLRAASSSQNQYNRRRRSDNTTGVKGVSRRREKYRVVVMARGKAHQIGNFSTKDEAAEAYEIAARSFHGEFARMG